MQRLLKLSQASKKWKPSKAARSLRSEETNIRIEDDAGDVTFVKVKAPLKLCAIDLKVRRSFEEEYFSVERSTQNPSHCSLDCAVFCFQPGAGLPQTKTIAKGFVERKVRHRGSVQTNGNGLSRFFVPTLSSSCFSNRRAKLSRVARSFWLKGRTLPRMPAAATMVERRTKPWSSKQTIRWTWLFLGVPKNASWYVRQQTTLSTNPRWVGSQRFGTTRNCCPRINHHLLLSLFFVTRRLTLHLIFTRCSLRLQFLATKASYGWKIPLSMGTG